MNFDFKVDFADLLTIAQKYGTTSEARWFQGDATYDGAVNFNDLILFAQNYGKSIPSGPVARGPIHGMNNGMNMGMNMGAARFAFGSTLIANLFADPERIID